MTDEEMAAALALKSIRSQQSKGKSGAPEDSNQELSKYQIDQFS